MGKVLGTAAARDAYAVFCESPPAFHIYGNMLEIKLILTIGESNSVGCHLVLLGPTRGYRGNVRN